MATRRKIARDARAHVIRMFIFPSTSMKGAYGSTFYVHRRKSRWRRRSTEDALKSLLPRPRHPHGVHVHPARLRDRRLPLRPSLRRLIQAVVPRAVRSLAAALRHGCGLGHRHHRPGRSTAAGARGVPEHAPEPAGAPRGGRRVSHVRAVHRHPSRGPLAVPRRLRDPPVLLLVSFVEPRDLSRVLLPVGVDPGLRRLDVDVLAQVEDRVLHLLEVIVELAQLVEVHLALVVSEGIEGFQGGSAGGPGRGP